MMKRMIYQLISVYLFLGVLASCSSEDEPGNAASATGISIELKTTGQTRSSVEPGTEVERQINSASVWFFKEGTRPDTGKAVFYKKIASSSSTGSLYLNFTDEELRLHNMTSEGKYEIYVVANLPADATIDGETTLQDLKGYSYTAASRPGSPFCMTGTSEGTHDFGKNSQISISLLRVASRLDITVKNATGKSWLINKISIEGDQKSVLLFAPASGTTMSAADAFGTAQTVLTTPTTNDEVTCTGYIYENQSANAVKVVIEGSVDGTAKTWTAELKPAGGVTVPRNTICDVTLNLKESAPISPTDAVSTIKAWDIVSVDGTIHGSYLYVDHNTVEVLFNIGGSIGLTTNATQIHVDWKNAPGFYLSGFPDDMEVTIPVTDSSTTLEFFFKGNTSDVVPNGEVILTAGNISQKITLVKENNNLLFDVKSVLVDGVPVADGGTTTFPEWNKGADTYIEIIMNTNIIWAYRMTVYANDGYPTGNTILNKIVNTSGAAGESTSGKLKLKYAPLIYDDPDLMPMRVEIELFLLNFSELGTKVRTFEFKVEKP